MDEKKKIHNLRVFVSCFAAVIFQCLSFEIFDNLYPLACFQLNRKSLLDSRCWLFAKSFSDCVSFETLILYIWLTIRVTVCCRGINFVTSRFRYLLNHYIFK